MKPAEKVLRSWVRSLPTDAGNVNIFNADGVLTRDRGSKLRWGTVLVIRLSILKIHP
jgi:hypothetical protein